MSKYFSIDTIMAAFSVLNKELKTGTGFSALQYMFAFDNFVCKYGRVSPRPFRHHLYCESAPPPTRPNIAVRHRH